MSDQDLGRLLKRIFQWAMASAIIGAVAVVLIVVMNWENSPLRGWHLVKDDAPPKTAPADKPVANDPPAHPRPVHHPRRLPPPPPEPVVEDRAAPVAAATPISMPSPAPAAVVVVVVAAPEEKHFIAHHKGRSGCDGDLIFTAASLRFDCPSRPGEALNFNRDAVRADDDGIRDLNTDHPYHFKISAMDKPQVCALFKEWAGR